MFSDCQDIQSTADFATEESEDNNVTQQLADGTVGAAAVPLPKQNELGSEIFPSSNFDNINFKRLEERLTQNNATSL